MACGSPLLLLVLLHPCTAMAILPERQDETDCTIEADPGVSVQSKVVNPRAVRSRHGQREWQGVTQLP